MFAVEQLEIDVFRARRLQFPHEFDRMPVRHDIVVSAVVDGDGEVFQRVEAFRGGTVRIFERTHRRGAAEARLQIVNIMLARFGEVTMPRGKVGNGTPDIHRAEDFRRILGCQQRGMAAARTSEQEDVFPVDRCGLNHIVHGVEDVPPRFEAAAGVGVMRIRGEVRPAEFRQQQRPAVLFAQRKIVLELVGTVVTPSVEPDDKRDGRIGLRKVEERRLKRAVERGCNKDRVRFSPRNEERWCQERKSLPGGTK